MFGLTRDFVEQGGTFMVLDRPEGLTSSHLSQVQLGMIRSSRIPCFLPLHTKELDFRVTLQYNITGKRMLSQALRGEKLTLTEFYGLLLQVTTVLSDCSMYMLRPTQYILDEEYMFIDGPLHSGKLYLTYVPLDKMESAPETVKSAFKDFLTRLVSSVSELRGNGIQSLMSYCNEEEFNLSGLKRLLIELLAGEGNYEHHLQEQSSGVMTGSMSSKSTDNTLHALGVRDNASVLPIRTRVAEVSAEPMGRVSPHIHQGSSRISDAGSPIQTKSTEAKHIRHNHNQASARNERSTIDSGSPDNNRISARSLFPSRNQSEWELSSDEMLEEKNVPSSVRTYWILGGLLGTAAVWRFLYLNNPSRIMLLISILGTVVLWAVSLLGWQGKIGRVSDEEDHYSENLPMFESGELGDAGGREHRSFRFKVDKLTGWFDGKSKDRVPDEDLTANEDWRWRESPPSPSNKEIPPRDLLADLLNNNMEKEIVASSDDYYDQLSQRTDMLSFSGDEGTVLLQAKTMVSKEEVRGASSQPYAFLEVVSSDNGRDERVELHQPHFIIGRSAEVSQYVTQAVGTSRAHVELYRSAGGYMIKDLGSKNGTILKGERMVPYKEYLLQEGDTFLIAGGKYTFRAS